MLFENPAIPEARSIKYFFKRQALHFTAVPILAAIAWVLAAPVMGDGVWLGMADTTWFWLALGLAVLHQTLVWIVFRAQLSWALLTRFLGRADVFVWGLVFLPLLAVRPVMVLGLAMSDRASLELPGIVGIVLGTLALIPALYTFWSVVRYFGLVRALGGDHFRPGYREMALVRKGAFRWCRNAMYAFAFLGLWSIALFIGSRAALSLALFQHAYVWVHYYCTEEPDMKLLYAEHA
jgi:hypothetical protein